MAAVYTQSAFLQLYSANLHAVTEWFAANPGKDVSDCATALSLPYAVVYQAVVSAGLMVLPSVGTELQFAPRHH